MRSYRKSQAEHQPLAMASAADRRPCQLGTWPPVVRCIIASSRFSRCGYRLNQEEKRSREKTCIGIFALLSFPSQELFQTHEALVTDNDVIDQLDVEDVTC